ncbi:MAG: TlpA family protein disulfide reductase [Bacteroidaceae bacterium]|nr:TlpA family protein disulfide reductase [Bacteroidaceae bacterium]
MKKIIAMFAVLAMMTATSCAQDSKPATKAMTREEVNAKLAPFFEKLNAVPEDGNEMTVVKGMAIEFVKENHNEAGVYVVRSVLSAVMSPEELIAYVDNDDFLKQDATIIESKKSWQVQMETSEGKMFKDFEAEYDGKVTKLSDYVGKGKYVLVDFWASWCGPCKAEIPNLIKVYNQYKGDKFEVLGVATWDKPEDTQRAIEQLHIPYPQMLNAQKAGSDAYGINGIPQIILFGPDGKILKRNLRGEALEKAVAEALK